MPELLASVSLFASAALFSAFTIAVYRLYLSPIAHFPGSKWTTLTGWVETYYDIALGGQFTIQIQKWHEQYGPIIRINPWDLHISDPNFYDIAYGASAHFDKIPGWQHRLGIPTAIGVTPEHDLHRKRRAAVNPYFSKTKIGDFSGYIQQSADKLCDRLLREYKGIGKVTCLNNAWAAMATDIIFHYCFAWDHDFLSYPDFVSPFTTSIKELVLSAHINAHFPWLLTFLQSLPQGLVCRLNPSMRPVFDFEREMGDQITMLMKGENEAYKNVAHKTIFHDILDSNLPQSEKSFLRMRDEAFGVVGAAIETTKSTLALACFYLLHKPDIAERLRAELKSISPRTNEAPSLSELERLPYLTAVIKEALRMSYGIAQRLPRVSKHPLRYNDTYTIPAGTPFCMSAFMQHNDPSFFPDSQNFDPDRWLEPNSHPNPNSKLANPVLGTQNRLPKPLSNYLVPFAKGTRMCIGQHLAMAELYIGLATLFRRVDLELFETTTEDVRMVREYFVPLMRPESKGVRVVVR